MSEDNLPDQEQGVTKTPEQWRNFAQEKVGAITDPLEGMIRRFREETEPASFSNEVIEASLEAREILAPKIKAGAVDELEARAKETRLYELMQTERERIINQRLSAQELEQVWALNQALKEKPEKAALLSQALLGFQSWDLEKLGVNEDKKKLALRHSEGIARLIADNAGEPLSEWIALIHDALKYCQNTTLLAEHEWASAVFGPQVLKLALAEAGLGEFSRGVVKLAEKAVICHGEMEFPELETKLWFENNDVGVLFGGLFPRPQRSDEIPLFAEEVATGSEDEEKRKLCVQVVKSISAADKIDGILPGSLAKYAQDISEYDLEKYASGGEYVTGSYGKTIVRNYEYAPPVPGLKNSELLREEVRRDMLLIALMQDAVPGCQFEARFGGELGDQEAVLFGLAQQANKHFADGNREDFGNQFALLVEKVQELGTVSYTHLRAHET